MIPYWYLPKCKSSNDVIESVFGWGNLILNFKNFKCFNWNSFIFKILCLDKEIKFLHFQNFKLGSTFYPELCFFVIAFKPNITHKTNHYDVIQLSLSITFRVVEHNYFTVKKLLTKHNLTKRKTTALHNWLKTIDETLDELKEAYHNLELYPNKKTLYQYADDLKTLISTAITN